MGQGVVMTVPLNLATHMPTLFLIIEIPVVMANEMVGIDQIMVDNANNVEIMVAQDTVVVILDTVHQNHAIMVQVLRIHAVNRENCGNQWHQVQWIPEIHNEEMAAVEVCTETEGIKYF